MEFSGLMRQTFSSFAQSHALAMMDATILTSIKRLKTFKTDMGIHQVL